MAQMTLKIIESDITHIIKDNTWLSASGNSDVNDCQLEDTDLAAKEIAKYIQAQKIQLLKTVVEHPTKPGYKRHDVLAKIKELENQLQ